MSSQSPPHERILASVDHGSVWRICRVDHGLLVHLHVHGPRRDTCQRLWKLYDNVGHRINVIILDSFALFLIAIPFAVILPVGDVRQAIALPFQDVGLFLAVMLYRMALAERAEFILWQSWFNKFVPNIVKVLYVQITVYTILDFVPVEL